MEALEQICFEIISNVGGARSSYIEAIDLARKREFEQAQASVKQGGRIFFGRASSTCSLNSKGSIERGGKCFLITDACRGSADECGNLPHSR